MGLIELQDAVAHSALLGVRFVLVVALTASQNLAGGAFALLYKVYVGTLLTQPGVGTSLFTRTAPVVLVLVDQRAA